MINLELTSEQANAALNALLLHTSKDSVTHPSARVVLLREVIAALDSKLKRRLTRERL